MLDMIGTRRDFVKGALLVTFGLAGGIAPGRAQQQMTAAKTVSVEEVDGFLAIGADGNVTVYSGKVDLGTGVRTALAQIAAEELDLPVDRVTIIQGDTALTPDQGLTGGSFSIQNGGMQIRQAAATARKALLEMSAQRLGVPAAELSASRYHRGGREERLVWRACRRPNVLAQARQGCSGERPGDLHHRRQIGAAA